jgi:NAD(P)-dependent dehydrogenase (short-subunit alcohol dehydrogenase family)
MDLADLDALPSGIEALKRRLPGGRLDALVNNAGVSPKRSDGGRLDAVGTDLEVWRHVFAVNLFSIALLARSLADELAAAKGSIVNVTSIAGSRVHPFAGAAYATSKAALAALTRELAYDLGPREVRVNAIAPGEIDTPILSPGTEALAAGIPLRRLGRAEEVAATIYFLCNAQASYVNGAEIHINGGQHV